METCTQFAFQRTRGVPRWVGPMKSKLGTQLSAVATYNNQRSIYAARDVVARISDFGTDIYCFFCFCSSYFPFLSSSLFVSLTQALPPL